MSTLYYESSFTHHGIRGMKWGIRRYQNKDGTLTPRGQKRYQKEMEKITRDQNVERRRIALEQAKVREARKTEQAKLKLQKEKEGLAEDKNLAKGKKPSAKPETGKSGKSIKDMSVDELRDAIVKVQLQQQLAALTAPPPSAFRKFADKYGNKVVSDLSSEVAKAIGNSITNFTKSAQDLTKAEADREKARKEQERKDAEWKRDKDREDAKWERDQKREDVKWERDRKREDAKQRRTEKFEERKWEREDAKRAEERRREDFKWERDARQNWANEDHKWQNSQKTAQQAWARSHFNDFVKSAGSKSTSDIHDDDYVTVAEDYVNPYANRSMSSLPAIRDPFRRR